MPVIGRPENTNNPYSNISLRPAQKEVDQSTNLPTGDSLNKMVGIKPEQRFVNRKEHEQMGPDGFMKLLAHQLKNQDPMKPMDQKDFSANLAQFSQLEQMTAMNKKMDIAAQNNIVEKKFQGASFLGKQVVTNGTTIDYNGDGKDAEIPFFLDKPAKNVIVRIFDNKNQMIGKVDAESIGKGMQSVSWNGIGLDGEIAPKEVYHFDVVAFDQNNEKFFGSTRAEGIITGVNFENGESVFNLSNGKKVYLRDIESFSMPNQMNNIEGKNIPALQKQAANGYNQLEKQSQ